MTPSRIKPATFRLLAQCLNQLRPPQSGYSAHIIRQGQLILHYILFRSLNIFNRGTPWNVQIGHCVYWWPESSVSIVIILRSGMRQNRACFLAWMLFCVFGNTFRLFLEPTRPPIEWMQWCLCLGIKWPERDADDSPQPPSLVSQVLFLPEKVKSVT
jgi:hypothetical protein